MDGHELEPPAAPAAPESPWARPEPGAAPITFDLQPVTPVAAAAASHRPWKPIAGALAVAAVAIGGVLVLTRGSDDAGQVEASGSAGLESVDAAGAATETVPTTAPATTTPVTVAPVPTSYVIREPSATTATEPAPPTTDAGPPPTVGPLDVAAGTYDYALIAAAEPAAQHVVVTTTSAGGETFAVDSSIDTAGRMSMTTDAAGSQFSMVLDVPAGVGYLAGADFAGLGTTGAPWIAVNLADFLELSGQSLDGLREQMSGSANPLAGAALEPTPLGLTDIDGEPVMLYYLDLDEDALADLLAASEASLDFAALDGLQVFDRLTYRFYVTEANTIRRFEMTGSIMGDEVTTIADYLPIPADFSVTLPDDADVELVDIAAALGQG